MATVVKKIKLQIPGGKATAAPPVGTVLGPAGVNIGQFVQQFNDATKDKPGIIIPVELSVMDDRSFTFVLKVSPMSRLILKALGIELPEPQGPRVAKIENTMIAGPFLFVSGQITQWNGERRFVGKVGREFDLAQGQAAAARVAERLAARDRVEEPELATSAAR